MAAPNERIAGAVMTIAALVGGGLAGGVVARQISLDQQLWVRDYLATKMKEFPRTEAQPTGQGTPGSSPCSGCSYALNTNNISISSSVGWNGCPQPDPEKIYNLRFDVELEHPVTKQKSTTTFTVPNKYCAWNTWPIVVETVGTVLSVNLRWDTTEPSLYPSPDPLTCNNCDD